MLSLAGVLLVGCLPPVGRALGDPSLFPTAASVDPAETIRAFSFLAATRMLGRW